MSDLIGRDDICTNCGAGYCDRCMGERLRTARAEGFSAGRRRGVEDALKLVRTGRGGHQWIEPADVRALLTCTCGSGGHPRRCAVHPEAYAQHCAELSAETPEPTRQERLAALGFEDTGPSPINAFAHGTAPEPRIPRAELDALGEQGAREKREYERRLAKPRCQERLGMYRCRLSVGHDGGHKAGGFDWTVGDR